ncbi:MAG: RsmD family RNA methyltransferase, partial [bacterium]
VLVPVLQTTLERVRNEFRGATAMDRLRDIEVVAGDEGVSVAPAVAGFKTDIISRRIGNETYHFSAEAFFQTNHGLLEPLIAEALRDVNREEDAATGNTPGEPKNDVRRGTIGKSAIDLYCGVGLFTLPLARRFERVIGVEGSARATDFARRNLEFAKLNNAEVLTSRVSDWLKQHARSFGPVDFLLLDPPRAGAENAVVAGILALRPARIAYVSCDPATLARDLKKLMAGGYALHSVVAFDMFPQTHHVETVAHLSSNIPAAGFS